MICTILIFFIAFLFLDWLGTFLYCYTRKKNYSNIKSMNNREGDLNRFRHEIVKYVDGYILYGCVISQFIPSHRIRKFILRKKYCMTISRTAMIYHGCEFRHPWNVSIGEGSSIGDHCKIDGRHGVEIKDNVNCGSGVWIWTEQHDYNDVNFACNDKGGSVTIGSRAWISSRTTILPKVYIGEGAVVAAGAVVTKDCHEFKLYAGCPAKVIGERNPELAYELKGQYLHFY